MGESLSQNFFFNKSFCFLNLFILFLAALGLHCCTWAFSSCGKRGLLFVVVHRLLIVVASLCCGAWALGMRASVVVAHGLSSCGIRAQLLLAMWDLPGPGLEPVCLALAGGFLTTEPQGKPLSQNFISGLAFITPNNILY